MSTRDEISFTLFSTGVEKRFSYTRGSREILASLEDSLVEANVIVNDVRGIAIVLGSGGFTGTRMATTVANTFAYARQISVVGVTSEEAKDISLMTDRLSHAKSGNYISALYSGEPSIGSPQSS